MLALRKIEPRPNQLANIDDAAKGHSFSAAGPARGIRHHSAAAAYRFTPCRES
jgi:hypothetical protein